MCLLIHLLVAQREGRAEGFLPWRRILESTPKALVPYSVFEGLRRSRRVSLAFSARTICAQTRPLIRKLLIKVFEILTIPLPVWLWEKQEKVKARDTRMMAVPNIRALLRAMASSFPFLPPSKFWRHSIRALQRKGKCVSCEQRT